MSVFWYVYVLLSQDQRRTYVGITTDPSRRLAQHNGDLPGGAKATRQGRPWTLALSQGPLPSRGDALRLEHQLKRRRGLRRLELPLPGPLLTAPEDPGIATVGE